MNFVTSLSMLSALSLCLAGVPATAQPQIVKRGTVECDLVEATPLVYKGKLCLSHW